MSKRIKKEVDDNASYNPSPQSDDNSIVALSRGKNNKSNRRRSTSANNAAASSSSRKKQKVDAKKEERPKVDMFSSPPRRVRQTKARKKAHDTIAPTKPRQSKSNTTAPAAISTHLSKSKSSTAVANAPVAKSTHRNKSRTSTTAATKPEPKQDAKKVPPTKPRRIKSQISTAADDKAPAAKSDADYVLESGNEAVIGAQKVFTDANEEKDIFYTSHRRSKQRISTSSPLKKNQQFMEDIASKLNEEGMTKDKAPFAILKIVTDLREGGTRFLCWSDELNGYYDIGDLRVINLAMPHVWGREEDEEEEEKEGEFYYDQDDVGNMVDSSNNPFYFSSERDPDHELTPSQEEVVDFTNEVDRNVKTPSGMMAMLKKHMLEKHQNNEYAGCTQHSALNLTPGENENATFDRAYEKLTEEANIRQYAETLRRADENHCQFYNKTSGGSVEDYQRMLSFAVSDGKRGKRSNGNVNTENYTKAVIENLESEVQKRMKERELAEEEGDASDFLSEHQYFHLPKNTMKAEQPGGDPVKINWKQLREVNVGSVTYPHTFPGGLPHLMAPDEQGSAMPLFMEGETRHTRDHKARYWLYDHKACKKGFFIGYACANCNPDSIRRLFTPPYIPPEYAGAVAAVGKHCPAGKSTRGSVSCIDNNGNSNKGLVGIHSWITTGYCSCDGNFYCFNCWPLHVEQEWNRTNTKQKCEVKSQHEYEVLPSRDGSSNCINGAQCGHLKNVSTKCSCQIRKARMCPECYRLHCIKLIKESIDKKSSGLEPEKNGNLKDDDNY